MRNQTSSVTSESDTSSITAKLGSLEESITPKRGWRFYGTFVCLCIANLVCAIDATILAVALPTIATEIKGTTAIQAFWCGTSFLLCSAVFQPTWASLSDIIGRKIVLLAALFLFTLGTIIASAATSISVLLVGRCAQGVGGGGLVCLTYVIVTDMVTLRDRGKWFSVIALQWAIGTITGPIIGGAIAVHTTWRWLFWVNLPFCGIAGVGIPICLRLKKIEGSVWHRLKKFDFLGSFLFVASTTSFLIPLTWGGVMYSWSSWRTLVPLIIGVVGLVGFVIYSTYVSSSPLIRRSLFKSATAKAAYFGTTVHGMIVWGLLYYLPLYFEVAKNYTPISSGIALFPFTFTSAPAAVIVGIVIAKSGRYRPSLWLGWFLITIGMGLMVCIRSDTSIPVWILIMLVPGTGLGILFSAQGFAAQAPSTNLDLGFAGALYSFFRALGQTLGVAISGVVFQNIFKQKLLDTAYGAYADEWSRDASSLVQVVKGWNRVGGGGGGGGEEGVMRDVVVEAYVEALRMVWLVMFGLAGVAFAVSFFYTAEICLSRELETVQGFVEGGRGVGRGRDKNGVSMSGDVV